VGHRHSFWFPISYRGLEAHSYLFGSLVNHRRKDLFIDWQAQKQRIDFFSMAGTEG